MLATAGPYRHVRNPQAIAARFIVAGEVLAVRSRWLWILLALTLLYLVGLARSLERRQLRRQIGEPYAAYERAVPRWSFWQTAAWRGSPAPGLANRMVLSG